MNKIYTYLEKRGLLIYQCIVICFLFMKANPYINHLLFTDVLMAAVVVIGALIFALLFLKNMKTIFKNKYFIPLYLFVATYLITILVNYQNSLLSNIKDVCWFVIQVATLYIFTFYLEQSQKEHNFKILSYLYITLSTIFSLCSIPFVFMAIGGVEEYGKWGFISQRLFGLYRSPNYGAIYCVIGIFLSLEFLVKRNTKLAVKGLCLVSILSNLLYVIYSGSNTGKVVLFAGMAVWCLLDLLNTKQSSRPKRIMSYLLLFTLLVVIFPATKTITSNVISYVAMQENNSGEQEQIPPSSDEVVVEPSTEEFVELSTEEFVEPSTEEIVQQPTEDTNVSTDNNEVNFNRTDFTPGSELGNGRLMHWQQAMQVYPHYMIFGTSMRGYMAALGNVFPETIGVQAEYSIENDFISLLVCTGAVGFIIFMCFMVIVLLQMKNLMILIARDKDPELIHRIRCPFVIVVVVAVSALFTDAIVFTNVVQSAVFWLSLGYLLNVKEKI